MICSTYHPGTANSHRVFCKLFATNTAAQLVHQLDVYCATRNCRKHSRSVGFRYLIKLARLEVVVGDSKLHSIIWRNCPRIRFGRGTHRLRILLEHARLL